MLWNTPEHQEKWRAFTATQLTGFDIQEASDQWDRCVWHLLNSRVKTYNWLTGTHDSNRRITLVYAARQKTCCGVLEFGCFPFQATLAYFPAEYHVTLFAEVLKRALHKERTNLVVSTLVERDQGFMYPILEELGFVKQTDTVNPKTTNRVDLLSLRLDGTDLAVSKYGYGDEAFRPDVYPTPPEALPTREDVFGAVPV